MKKSLILILAVLCSLLAAASADTLTLDGTVIAAETVQVYAPIGGTVDAVAAEAGQTVAADDVLFSFRTTKVYAAADGTVTGVFGEPGDSASAVADRYGAVLYIEEGSVYSVSASTDNAYNATATKFVHVGETVYLQCKSNTSRTGVGTITAISGTSYTVKVTEGSFIPGDTVYLYRDAAYTGSQKVGQGTVSRVSPTAVTASGAIVRIAVKDGDQVKKGDVLLETLDGTFDAYYMTGTDVTAGTDGVLGSISASKGGSVQGGAAVAVIWTTGTMRVETAVPEDSRGDIKAGDKVLVELEADESVSYEGTVVLVSALAEDKNGEASYKVLVDFTPDSRVTFGMSVLVTTLEAEEEDAEAEPEAEPEAEAEAAGEAPAEAPSGRPEGFSGKPDGDFPGKPEGGFPEGFSGKPGEGTDGDADQ